MNMYGETFLLKLLLFAWVICVVWCELQKRDVHRIILKTRSPRSHKKSHRHSHNHYKQHKKAKKLSRSSEEDSSSYEDSSSEERNETSSRKHKTKDHRSHPKPETPISIPSYPSNLDVEETRFSSYGNVMKPYMPNQWLHLYPNFPVMFGNNREQRHDGKNMKQPLNVLKPLDMEVTTPYSLNFDISTLYPPLILYQDSLKNYETPNKFGQTSQGTIEQQSRNDFKDVSKTVNTLISVPDFNQEQKQDIDVVTQKQETTTPKLLTRGKIYRGRSRF